MKSHFQSEIQQMMFVMGESREPTDESLLLVEDITKRQILEIITRGLGYAHRRNSRIIQPQDLIFTVRDNPEKVARLREFLSWKDVRKNLKDNSYDEVDADVEREIPRQKFISFFWDPFAEFIPDRNDTPRFDESEVIYDQDRLKKADLATRDMSKEEYIYYAECRQASFTFKKLKRFRDWCEMQKYYENKSSSDVMDILGFFAYECVRSLTEMSLQVKKEWDQSEVVNIQKDSPQKSLFTRMHATQTPLMPSHIQEAFRRLQKRSGLRGFSAFKSSLKPPLTII